MKLLFIVLMMSWLISPSKAQDVTDPLTVITSFYEPYSFSFDGQTEGIAVDRVRLVLSHLDYDKPIRIYPWARAYNQALFTPNSLLFSVARTPEREEKFHWIGQVINFDVALYKDAKREDIVLKSIADANRYIVAALVQDVKGQYLNKNGVSVTSIPNEENGIKMVLNNNVQLVPMDAGAMKFRLKKLNLPESALVPAFHLTEISRPLYMAMHRDSDPKLVDAVRSAYQKAFPLQGE